MNQNFRKLLQFAIIGISNELRTIQDNIILHEKFGSEAIDYPDQHRFDMETASHRVGRLSKLYKQHAELREIACEAQDILNAASEVEIAAAVAQYFKK